MVGAIQIFGDLGCKMAKAAWHIMANGTDYDGSRMFPDKPTAKKSQPPMK